MGRTVDYVFTPGGKANANSLTETEIHFINGSVLRVGARSRLPKEA